MNCNVDANLFTINSAEIEYIVWRKSLSRSR